MEYKYAVHENEHFILINYEGYTYPIISKYFQAYLNENHPEAKGLFTFFYVDPDGNWFLLNLDGTIINHEELKNIPESEWSIHNWGD